MIPRPHVSPRIKRYVKRAGAFAVIVIAIDLLATAATLALGIEVMKG